MTIMLELTPDVIQQLEKQERKVLKKHSPMAKGHEQIVLKILKPSRTFYNKVLQYWFKFTSLESDTTLQDMLEPQLKAIFFNFCKR